MNGIILDGQGLTELPDSLDPNILELSAANNQLRTPRLTGIALTTLNLSINLVEGLDDLPPLPDLLALDLSDNALVSTFGITAFPKLREIDMSGNNIHVLDGFELLALTHLLADRCIIII